MNVLLLWGCAPETAFLAACSLETDPPIGALTDEFESQHEVPCSDTEPLGFAIYVGGVDLVDGPSADMRFRKAASNPLDAPSTTIEWFIVEDPDQHHECVDAGTDRVVASGLWEGGLSELLVPDVPVFESTRALEEAEPGAEVALYLVTTGGDEVGVRRWWQKDSVVFTRSCPEDEE